MTLSPSAIVQSFAEADAKIRELKEERSALYRLIEGACDKLLGIKNAREGREVASLLRARAQQIHDGRATDQTELGVSADGKE